MNHPELAAGPLQQLGAKNTVLSGDQFFIWAAENESAESTYRGGLDLDPPYQRGLRWSEWDQRLLFASFMRGLPVPSLIINDRSEAGLLQGEPDEAGHRDDWRYSVIDGKQRITAILAWLRGELTLPRAWFTPEEVSTLAGDDEYVNRTQLTPEGDRILRQKVRFNVVTANLEDVASDAEVYLLVNRAGAPQTEADLARAESVAER